MCLLHGQAAIATSLFELGLGMHDTSSSLVWDNTMRCLGMHDTSNNLVWDNTMRSLGMHDTSSSLVWDIIMRTTP
jgi:hypothetical protein